MAFHLTDLSALGEKTLEQDMGQISSTPSVLEFNPIIYTDPQMPLPEESLADLKKVADWLKKYPLLKMVFVGYAEEGDDGLESARTTLQKVASFLIDENVPLRQFKLQAVGDLSISLKKETRQIDLFIVNPEILPIPIKPTSLEGATFKQKFFRKTMNSLVYQVQVPIKGITTVDELLHFYPEGILMEHPVNNQVWFTPGYQLSWAAALETEQAIKKVGFFDAETVPLLNGWELSKKEAARHLHEYPALTSFIERD